MIEEMRQKMKKRKKGQICQLPSLSESKRVSYDLVSSQNTLKLCRVGAQKKKFINFDLKNPSQHMLECRSDSRYQLPLFKYKQNKFGYLRNHTHRNQHSLLVSRMHKQNWLPSIGDYDTSNYQKIKYPQSKNCLISNHQRQSRIFFGQTNR